MMIFISFPFILEVGGPSVIRAWVGHLVRFIFKFFLMITYYFLIIKNISFSIMKKYKMVVYKKKNSY